MRISDWSSDVCSSDLPAEARLVVVARHTIGADAALERGNCADRHHFLGVVTRLKISNGMQVLAEPTVGLRCYAKRSAHQAELVDERQAEIDLQGLERAACRHTQDLGLDTIDAGIRSEEHTSELQSLLRNSYSVFCLKKKNRHQNTKVH